MSTGHPDLVPVAYVIRGERIPEMVRIERRVQVDKSERWCVKVGEMVLSKRGGFEQHGFHSLESEPLPSERTADFYERTRWATPEEAYGAYKMWRDRA